MASRSTISTSSFMSTATTAAVVFVTTTMMMILQAVRGQTTTNPDINACRSTLFSLNPCLQFVAGNSNIPTPDCCTALGKVVNTQPRCLCVLLRYHEDQAFQTFNININSALQLPTKCQNPAADVNKCPGLLGIDPNSREAQIFRSNGTSTNGSPSTPTVPAITPQPQRGGSNRMRSLDGLWSGTVLAAGTWMYFTSFL